jgi:hypothetical protein
MPRESVCEQFGRSASPHVGNALETPPSAATLGIKLEHQGFGVSSVHASLVMFINAGIRLTIRA